VEIIQKKKKILIVAQRILNYSTPKYQCIISGNYFKEREDRHNSPKRHTFKRYTTVQKFRGGFI